MKKTMTDINKEKETQVTYAFYSKVLNKVFDSVEELKAAEEAHAAELKAKEDKVATKKADAQKVEDAFKALNAARKTYKTNLVEVTKAYNDGVAALAKTFKEGKELLTKTLAEAEDAYSKALKEFTSKYETYHLSLKDGDFETTISSETNMTSEPVQLNFFDFIDNFFKRI